MSIIVILFILLANYGGQIEQIVEHTCHIIVVLVSRGFLHFTS